MTNSSLVYCYFMYFLGIFETKFPLCWHLLLKWFTKIGWLHYWCNNENQGLFITYFHSRFKVLYWHGHKITPTSSSQNIGAITIFLVHLLGSTCLTSWLLTESWAKLFLKEKIDLLIAECWVGADLKYILTKVNITRVWNNLIFTP